MISKQKVDLHVPPGMLEQLKRSFLTGLLNLMPPQPMFSPWRVFFLKILGVNINKRAFVLSPISFSVSTSPKNIFIGRSFINGGVRLSVCKPGSLVIGNEVLVGPNVCFENLSHFLPYTPNTPRGAYVSDIVIEDGVWIGLGANIMQGVKIQKGAVVAAGAIVTKDVKANTLVAGIPARVIKEW